MPTIGRIDLVYRLRKPLPFGASSDRPEAADKIDHMRTLLRAARKHVDPVIQYRLIEAIDAAIGNKRTSLK